MDLSFTNLQNRKKEKAKNRDLTIFEEDNPDLTYLDLV
jgi:hypothetical protein